MLLACCYDAGYVPFLAEFAGNEQLSKRITIVQGGLPCELKAGFRTIQFENVFVGKQNGGRSKIPPTGPRAFNSLSRQYVYQTSARFGPVIRDGLRRRMDKQLNVSKDVYEDMAKQGLCHWFYLRGSCFESSCSFSHAQTVLTEQEWNALWLLARRGKCRIGRDCGDAVCIYGHN